MVEPRVPTRMTPQSSITSSDRAAGTLAIVSIWKPGGSVTGPGISFAVTGPMGAQAASRNKVANSAANIWAVGFMTLQASKFDVMRSRVTAPQCRDRLNSSPFAP